MSEEEIIEGNILIAKFMCISTDTDGYFLFGCNNSVVRGSNLYEYCSTTTINYDFTKKEDCEKAVNIGNFYYNISSNNLRYCYQWNWLIPVVQKIGTIKSDIFERETEAWLSYHGLESQLMYQSVEKIFEEVVIIIKEYNRLTNN